MTTKNKTMLPGTRVTKTVLMTPAMAKDILENSNFSNRKVRIGKVHSIAHDIKRGHFYHTHQGIGFDWNGNLIDGQHRLAAIVEADTAVNIDVTTGLDPNTAQKVDQGTTRNAADILGCNSAISSAVMFITRLRWNDWTTERLFWVYDVYGETLEALHAKCPRSRKQFASAAFRACTAMAVVHGKATEDHAFHIYRSLVENTPSPYKIRDRLYRAYNPIDGDNQAAVSSKGNQNHVAYIYRALWDESKNFSQMRKMDGVWEGLVDDLELRLQDKN